MANPQVAIDIAANDKTAKGINSADKRFKKLGGDVEKIGGKGGFGNLVKTIGDVDKAAAKAFGTKSALGSIVDKAAKFKAIGSALGSGLGRSAVQMDKFGKSAKQTSKVLGAWGKIEHSYAKGPDGTLRKSIASVGGDAVEAWGDLATATAGAEAGMGEAAAAAGGLAVAMGPVGIAVGAVAVTLGAAAAASYKFASGWAANTAQLGRFADMIGVTTAGLQQLQGAGERYGIGKDATNQGVANFAQTVHDARYGRNNDALALMMRLGVKFKTGKDGNLDYDAMLADTSDALARQKDPQTRLMIANRLGIAGMLPLLAKGSGNLRSEEADVAKNGVMNTSADIAKAQAFDRSRVQLTQMAERAKQGLQAKDAAMVAPALAEAVKVGQGSAGVGSAAKAIGAGAEKFLTSVANDFVPAAKQLSPAAAKIDAAADKMLAAAGSGASGSGVRAAGRFSANGIAALARRALPLKVEAMQHGFNEADATAIAANMILESGGSASSREKGGSGQGRGLIQWTDAARKSNFRRIMGVDVDHSSREQQWQFLRWELGHTEAPGWVKAHANGDAHGAIAEGFSRYIERSYDSKRDSAERGAVAQAMDAIPVHVTIELKNAPSGTRARVIAGRGSKPAISHAMEH